MFDCENEMCCYTCLNGEYVQDNDTGYHVLCKKDDEYKKNESRMFRFQRLSKLIFWKGR